ncbi:MAG TPA: hypothetical protein VF475_14635 [Sphingobium sp.]
MAIHESNMVFTEILAKIDRAAINGQKLHLDVEHVRALASSPVYATIAEMKAQEFAELWDVRGGPTSQPEYNSGSSGLSRAPSVESGASLGTMQPLAHAAAERQASNTVEKLSRLSKRKKHSRTGSRSAASPKSR